MRASLVKAIAAIGALACTALAAAPAAGAPGRQVTTTMTGALTIAWQADPARGCAAAGLCGVSGSLEMLAGGSGQSSSSSGGGPSPIQAELMDPTAAARVMTLGAAGAPDATCTDLVP
ncbi:MAG: hypothetical protein ACRDMJ_00630, partial [Solirubrobacteraceae bacterium]